MYSLSTEVIDLLTQLPLAPEDSPSIGVLETTILEFERRMGLEIPPNLRRWLKTSNGSCVGPGGVFGIETTREYLNIEAILNWVPVWKQFAWIPIAGDGCGNYYCVVTRNDFGIGEPVIFIDTIDNPSAPKFVVASETWHFLRFLFKKELGQSNWPFSEAEVLRDDPDIVRFCRAAMPWKTR